MIDRIKSLFGSSPPPPASEQRHDIHLAAAALLMVAALQDDGLDARETGRVRTLLQARFGLDVREVERIVEEATARARDAVQILPFTQAVKAEFSHAERVEMVEMLWEVVYADGVLQDHEAALMRRIGGLIYVSDRERGEARRRALSSLKKAGVPVARKKGP